MSDLELFRYETRRTQGSQRFLNVLIFFCNKSMYLVILEKRLSLFSYMYPETKQQLHFDLAVLN